MTEEKPSDQPPRFNFSLKTLMVGTFLTLIPLGYVTNLVGRYKLGRACDEGDPKRIKDALICYVDTNNTVPYHGNWLGQGYASPFLADNLLYKPAAVKALLEDGRADLSIEIGFPNHNNARPLVHYIIHQMRYGKEDSLKLLVQGLQLAMDYKPPNSKLMADLNATDQFGYRPLDLAFEHLKKDKLYDFMVQTPRYNPCNDTIIKEVILPLIKRGAKNSYGDNIGEIRKFANPQDLKNNPDLDEYLSNLEKTAAKKPGQTAEKIQTSHLKETGIERVRD